MAPPPPPPKRRGRPRSTSSAETQQTILTAAERLFADAGYEATSLRQIAAAADVDIATVKYHFDDKPTLFARVYGPGHGRFFEAVAPHFAALGTCETAAEVRRALGRLVERVHDFVEEDRLFVRLTLYRMLEESEDVIVEEEQLQQAAIQTLAAPLDELAARGVVAPIDGRACVVFLVTSFSTWNITARTKPGWLGPPPISSDEGRQRSVAFFRQALERLLGVEDRP